MTILAYLSLLFVGLTLAIVGGGGSILTVPIFVYLFDLPAELATSYSLFIVGSSAAVGAYKNYKIGQVNFQIGAIFAVPAFVGVFLVRKFLMPLIPESFSFANLLIDKDQLIMASFAVIMLLASVSMIKGRKEGDSSKTDEDKKLNFPVIVIEGLIVGGVTGFVGAGGGFLIIPALVILARIPMKEAVGTSLMIITFKSLLGFTGDIGQLPIDWNFLLLSSAISIFGILIGSVFAKKIPGQKLKKGFGYFVLVMGAFIIIQQVI